VVSQEEIRRIRLEYARKTGRIELDMALIEAANARAPPENIARILRDYRLGKITRKEASRRLRELARRAKAGNGRRTR